MDIKRNDQFILYSICGVAFGVCVSSSIEHFFKVLLFIGVILKIIYCKDKVNVRQYKNLFIAIGIFLSTLFLSAIFGEHPLISLKNDFLGIVQKMLIFFVIILCLNKKKSVLIVLNVLFISLFFTDLYAIWQGIHGSFRALPLRGNVMWLGSFLAASLPVLWVIVLNGSKFNKKWFLYFMYFLCSLIALFFNGTRGVWLGMALLLPVLLFIHMRNIKNIIAIMLLSSFLFGGIYSLVLPFQHRVNTIFDMNYQSNKERTLLWRSSLNMVKDYPFLGVGLGDFAKQYHGKYILPEAKERHLEHAHNNFIHIMAENGIIGLSGFCIMFGYFICFSWKKWKNNRNIYALMAIGATLGFLSHGLTEYNFVSAGSITFYWILLALCIKASVLAEE